MTPRLVLEVRDRSATKKRHFQRVLRRAGELPHELYSRYITNQPNELFRRALLRRTNFATLEADGELLCNRGLCILPRYFSGPALEGMQADFAHWCTLKPGMDSNKLKDFDGGKAESFLPLSEYLSRAAVDPYLNALAAYYLGKPIRLAYCHGYRIEPIAAREYRAFRWHHDLKRKQIRIMVLLTDTPADGQRMDYIEGSHRTWHKFSNQRESWFSGGDAESLGRVVPCAGPAGTVVVFDSNGIHRGNRNTGPTRDQYTFNFTAGSALFPLPGLHPRVVSELTPQQKLIARTGGPTSFWFRVGQRVGERFFPAL